ncbi:MAG TPA: energy transducer TonB [Rhodanobacteraceae bacterium]
MTFLVVIAIIVGILAAAWFLIIKPRQAAIKASQPLAQTAGKVVQKTAPPVNVASLSTQELLAEASKAIKDQRLLAPQGNNAFEFYLQVLARQPNNQVAKDALRETFPFAANAAEQVINQGQFDEADREIGLLAKADPDNYTLTILRSKLDAQRKVKVQQAQLLAQQQQQAATEAKQAAAQAKQKAAEQAKQKELAAQTVAAEKSQPATSQASAQQQPAAAPAAPKVVIQGAVLIKRVEPRYPPAAQRMRRQGWVLVEYTVGTNGEVSNAHVIASQPHHVFDREAVRAVSRWVYKPALRNGKPMPVTMQQRIEFTLGSR